LDVLGFRHSERRSRSPRLSKHAAPDIGGDCCNKSRAVVV
jgi:hypothetical protein